MRKFTHEQLMQYVYGEASAILKLAIDKALLTNEDLAKEVRKLKRTQKQLETLKHKSVSPSLKTVEAILEYAKTGKRK